MTFRPVFTDVAGARPVRSGMETMRRLFSRQLAVLLFAGLAVGAQIDNSNQNGQPPGGAPGDSASPPGAGEAPTTPTITPGITVNGSAPSVERALPALPPDEFTDCMRQNGLEAVDRRNMAICAAKLNMERHIVIDRCINSSGKSTPPMVIQACTESLDHKILEGNERFFLFVNRAEAYLAQGDKQRALDDYNQAVKLAPRNAALYYNRGVFYAAQPDGDAALQDFDTALSLKPKLVPALRERAKIYQTRSNFSGAVADYSEAIRLEPKTAALWSERGYLYLQQHDPESALKDEAEAIRLDPKLARAYFLRGAAFGGLGDSANAVSDLVTAVRLDPSLDRFVTSRGKNVSLTLPP
jgi:tetratricopeptide (TPR) repeat protein